MSDQLKQAISQAMITRFEIENKLIHQAWENEAFKQGLLNNPKAFFARELGEELPNSLEIEVLEETEKKVYLVLPTNPATSGDEKELSEEDLETVAGGVCTLYSLRAKGCFLKSLAFRNANDKV